MSNVGQVKCICCKKILLPQHLNTQWMHIDGRPICLDHHGVQKVFDEMSKKGNIEYIADQLQGALGTPKEGRINVK